jgi:tetratricopeptide (TPR) repeat protein
MNVVPVPAAHEGPSVSAAWFRARAWFLVLAAIALTYALLAGLRTVSDFDLFWQMASGRWVAQHHAIFSTEIFSYTAQGQPWIYPVGSGLLFYGAFLLGGYSLISWLGALACVGTVALLLRRASAFAAILAIVAVPAIAVRTTPRANMFTVVLFAAFLTILWERYERGTGRLWLLPPLMVVWVNLHLGFISGLALAGLYAAAEAFRLLTGKPVSDRARRLKLLLAWSLAMVAATLVNPWGWSVYRAIFRQEEAMQVHSIRIAEWTRITITSSSVQQALGLRDPGSSTWWLLLAAAAAVIVAVFRRQWPAAVVLAGSLGMTMMHIRYMSILSSIVVVIAGAVLAAELERIRSRFHDKQLAAFIAGVAAAAVILLACLRSADLVSNRYYLSRDEITTFGPGLSWWFPERAMAFLEHENLPPQIFNGYETGGFLLWRLDARYKDFIDGRAIPFGPDSLDRLQQIQLSPPDSSVWQQTAETHGINAILFSLPRYGGLTQAAAVLPHFCTDETWRPVYFDEVSAIFVRRQPATQALIDRYPVDCSTTPLPAAAKSSDRGEEFNRWANSAAVLLALNRSPEALDASTHALNVFSGSAALWYIRAKALLAAGQTGEAERDLLQSAALEDRVPTWSVLADLYRRQRRIPAAVDALEHLVAISPDPSGPLLALGYTYVDAGKPGDAMEAFDKVPRATPTGAANPAVAEADNGSALAWSASGDLAKAATVEEKAVALAPQNPNYWNQLAHFYELQGRAADALRASQRAAALSGNPGR